MLVGMMDFILCIILMPLSNILGQRGNYFGIYMYLLYPTPFYSVIMMIASSSIEKSTENFMTQA
jgi:hypothetical protein